MSKDWFEEMEQDEQERDAHEYELSLEYKRGRAEAIEDFKEKCKSKRFKPYEFANIDAVHYEDIEEIAEQMKE